MKTAIVTGASRGIGRAVMKKLLADGYAVIGTCIKNPELIEELKTQGQCFCFTGDLEDPSVCRELIRFAEEQFDHIDVLVNNAGICESGLVQDIDDLTFFKIMDTNFTSVFACTRSIVPIMLRQGRGSIVNVSSIWGEYGAACDSVYCASKGAVNAFTKSVAMELEASGIRVNAIAPGAVDTDMNASYSSDERAEIEAQIPLGRMYTPDEVADEILRIIDSDETGKIITFDGGWYTK